MIDELKIMHEQDIEELESLDLVQSEERITARNWTAGLSLVKKGLQISEYIDTSEKFIFFNKGRNKKFARNEEILWEKENT
ncbi:hypothetical protein TNCV_4805871 [Trichonephila clavipes]|nr:hypothetical protein TNCV_4805871 [Trichonephila clavipes]